MFKALGILFVMKLYASLGYLIKSFAFESDSYFWKKLTLIFTFSFYLRTITSLCSNLRTRFSMLIYTINSNQSHTYTLISKYT